MSDLIPTTNLEDFISSDKNLQVTDSFTIRTVGFGVANVVLNKPVIATLLYPISESFGNLIILEGFINEAGHTDFEYPFKNPIKIFEKEYYAQKKLSEISFQFKDDLEASFILNYLNDIVSIREKTQEKIVKIAFDESVFGDFKRQSVCEETSGRNEILNLLNIKFNDEYSSRYHLNFKKPLDGLHIGWNSHEVEFKLDDVSLPSIPFSSKDIYGVYVVDNSILTRPFDHNNDFIAYNQSLDIIPQKFISGVHYRAHARTQKWSIKPSNVLDLITTSYFFQKTFPETMTSFFKSGFLKS